MSMFGFLCLWVSMLCLCRLYVFEFLGLSVSIPFESLPMQEMAFTLQVTQDIAFTPII